MRKHFFGPFDLVLLTFVWIISSWFFFVVLSNCFGQECVDGTCDKANAPQQSQVRFAPAGTIESQKNPAVVRIEHDDYKGRGYFTGFFIVAPNGLRTNILVTAAHCFDGPGETRIYLPDGRTFKGEILVLDHVWDVAVVMVEGANIPAMRLATVPPAPGDKICAYGYGWVGKQYARMCGVALGYSISRGQNVANTLRCSFKVRDGDSGGPIVNSRHEVVAVITHGDNQSGAYGTWAARIKVIVDRAIARKIAQVDFVSKKEDIGRLPLPPIAHPVAQLPAKQRVAPLAMEVGADDVVDDANVAVIERLRSMLEAQSLVDKKENTEVQETNVKVPFFDLSLPTGLVAEGTTPSILLSTGLQIAAAAAGVGLTGGVGWGGWVALKALLAIYRRRKGKSTDSPVDNFSTLPRKAKEARQFLQLSELEGRSPLYDALIGRLALDELDDTIDSDQPEKNFAIEFKERIMRRFNEIAPVSVENASNNTNQGV